MEKVDLSILIPARNEMFLKKTVENVLQNIEGNTEIIVLMDGDWSDEGLEDNERVKIIKTGSPVGQRQATNLCAKLSTAKYIMKLDAHCTVAKGFDVVLMKDCEYDQIMIPRQYNLHAFDWKCKKCGNRWYQSPTPTKCQLPGEGKGDNTQCDSTEFERVIVFEPRKSKKSDFWRFDSDLHFQYWGSFETRPEAQGDIAPTMSCLGACWFLHRDKYWELGGLDEDHGSWGQMGTELACKIWLSGGQMVTNKKTWFSHMFRTQGGDFGFPYPLSSKDVSKARKHSQNLWKNNKWDKAIHDLQWLVDKFSPVPGWDGHKQQKKLSKGVVYYTDNNLRDDIAELCREQITKGIKEKHIVSVSLQPLDFGTNITMKLQRGYLTMSKQILAGLKAQTADVIFFCEHDVMYDPSHFDFLPPDDKIYYNTNVWQYRLSDKQALFTKDCRKLSQLCAKREILIQHYEKRVQILSSFKGSDDDFNKLVRQMGFEPGTHNRKERVDDLQCVDYQSRVPSVDLRHDGNLTPTRFKKDQYRNKKYTQGWTLQDSIPGWQSLP